MFHPQINYSMLLIEENAEFFHLVFFFFFFLPPELDCGALASLSHLFFVLLCDTHTEWITFLSPAVVLLQRAFHTGDMIQTMLHAFYNILCDSV